MFNRLITPSKNSSFFLFGARGTGKSTWLKQEFLQGKPHIYIDLLNLDQEELYLKSPQSLYDRLSRLEDKKTWVVIDEVQKIPKLLDVVHQSIEEHKIRFALTGSSARKLKRGKANLLAGRAFVYHMFPLTHVELGEGFDLEHVLQWGSLPKIFEWTEDQDRARYLRSYTQSYLKEEIQMEQVVRKLDPFRQFLEVAAQHNGEIINYSSIARDVGVDTVTVQSYFQILDDTMMGYILPAHHRSIRKQQSQNPKFYYFDLGVKRSLDGTIVQAPVKNTFGYGKCFEHFLVAEIIRLNSYHEKDFRLSYLRSKDGAEIDLIIERPGMPLCLVEIKSSQRSDERDIRTLKAYKKDMGKNVQAYCLSQDPTSRLLDGIHLLHWREGLGELGLL